MAKAQVGKTYEHFKGGGYIVVMLGRDSETTEDVVVYRSLYSSDEYPEGTIWVRSREDFEWVKDNGIERFSLVRDWKEDFMKPLDLEPIDHETLKILSEAQ